MYESAQRRLEREAYAPSPQERADVVIIGFGIAGMTAAREVHRLEPGVQILIVATQNYPTIHTPSLKQFLMGRLSREQLVAVPPDMERVSQISLLRGKVSEIITSEKCISLVKGGIIGYGSLLIATGSTPRRLTSDIPGNDFDGVITAYSMSDYLDLRRRLIEANSVVVIGEDIHALETVMSILHHRLPVTWLLRTATCLPHYLDEAGSQLVLEYVQQAGAKIITETDIVEILGSVGAVRGIVTSGHQVLPAQLIVTSIGTTPQTRLAAHCDRPMLYQPQQGIFVDDWLQTNVAQIFAAGSVAALKDPRTGAVAAREHWAESELQGALAAGMLLGQPPREHSPLGTSWQNVSIGKLSILAVGDTLGHTEGASTWSESRRGNYRRITVHRDHVVGYLAVGATIPDPLAIKYVIDERLSLSDISKVLMEDQATSSLTPNHEHTRASRTSAHNVPEQNPALLYPYGTFTGRSLRTSTSSP